MANSKITELTELTAAASTDILPIVDDPAGTPITKKITIASLSATAADMEAGTSTGTFVTPAQAHRHPSACKFWAQVTGAGTPSLTTNYNVTSIADTNVGRMTITFTTDFSSANWCCLSSNFTSTATGNEGIPNIQAKAAGTVEVGNRVVTPAAGDPTVGYDVAGFGDQT